MPGTWSPSTRNAPFNVGTALLLTDGTVLAQDDSTADWWRLYPSPSGGYHDGTWLQTAPAHVRRQFFASAVLADGRVLVAGGKFGDVAGKEINLPAVEIYDPVEDDWIEIGAPATWEVLGDAPCCMLPDASVLVGNIESGQCALFDAAQDAWRPAATKLNASARGETWTLLPDGSVLAINCKGHPASERYIGGVWRSEGNVSSDLVENASLETGPALLRPDGSVFALGATGGTSIFTPVAGGGTGVWRAGPALPQDAGRQVVAKDAPACLLPNGTILFAGSTTSGDANDYGATSIFYEWDGTGFTPAPGGPTLSSPPFKCRLLVLPNGQAMLCDSSPGLFFYTPAGAASAAWLPAIIQAPQRLSPGSSVNVLRGQRLNGISQACAFGDDAAQATNYPLVRLVSKATPTTVTYCRTYGHSTMGVATGAAEHSTNFSVPAGVALGDYDLEVVANGIASAAYAVSVVLARQGGGSLTLDSMRDVKDDRALQEKMFWRDLNEVHLLMDYISGRADKSLSDLKDVPYADAPVGNAAAAGLSPHDALQRVCLIRFPPEGTAEKKANDALLLLMVKDRLNALAFPARGLSVAFTAMFAGTAGATGKSVPMRVWKWIKASQFGEEKRDASRDVKAGPKRHVTGFAIASYPNLEWTAAKFRVIFGVLPFIAGVWLLLTAVTSWDVAVSSLALQNQAVDIDVAAKAGATPANCKIVGVDGAAAFAAGSPAPNDACRALLRSMQPLAYADDIDRRAIFVDDHLPHPISFALRYLLIQHKADPKSHPVATAGQCPAPDACPTQASVWALAGIVVSVFTNYVLPMMFGVLGTFAGLMRGVMAKVRDSTLGPRDYRLVYALVPLGAVAGLAVGLFFTPGNAFTGASALTLPATGLAFLAGYGADSFFGMIDALLLRVFALNTAPSSGSK